MRAREPSLAAGGEEASQRVEVLSSNRSQENIVKQLRERLRDAEERLQPIRPASNSPRLGAIVDLIRGEKGRQEWEFGVTAKDLS